MSDAKEQTPRGPIGYLNWRAAVDGRPAKGAQEVPLYTDMPLFGEITEELGPYQILNNIPYEIPGRPVQRNFTLYMNHFLTYDDLPRPHQTDVTGFHGGNIADELAALCSLENGTRIKAGGVVRLYTPHDQPRGRPRVEQPGKVPYLPQQRHQSPILPFLSISKPLKADLLKGYHRLTARDASALAKAAIFYQEAIWIAESSPELSWLMLVTAIEIAASAWKQSTVESNKQLLEELHPVLTKILRDAAGEEHISNVADVLAHLLAATKKFISFLIEFLPEAPPNRPESANLQQKWSKRKLKEAFSKIYEVRSYALHAGIPVTPLMCDPPLSHEGRYAEVPTALGASVNGGSWTAQDAPMLLHTFEYITRGALLRWWRSIDAQAASRAEQNPSQTVPASGTQSDAQPSANTPESQDRDEKPENQESGTKRELVGLSVKR